ncbi:deazaflavin-dependent oxidoreductase (nitroreductase family) [Streptosporangium becharense]|uniref:Deazaflavin-dependent oxidoreductase (Nitroreductase family) n=1 Tax=Streptosporangium becharense TaxID=1816182 RepID=A0A7W9MJV4_9ACTN|nr:nitroreductase/quinone reductase family protein [Streptosporangium becharense]MBB2914620.1 deazaflavin-dependent oxidoreductase (nitroreductase family) [Streptosporangium becharense]MBB5823465.1 deazaflavin-dependent oxidoreductase (nitroreductase family) [Streptosporangium becharense]
MPNDFNQQVIEEFRANGGRVGGPFEGGRLLLLTTTGARSGVPHTTPVGYLPDGGDRVLVIASAGGAPRHPDWFHNLVADPRVTVEDGVFTYEARAVVLEGAERDRAFARAAEADPGWAVYQAGTTRVIPVVALEQVAGGPPNAASWGEALRLIHDAFRRELALIRKEVAESGPRLGAQLRVNCLTLCRGLHHHHTNEDAGMFPHLAEHHPELAPALDRLRLEHERIAALLGDLQKVISADDADPALTLSEVERLTDELESHLTYEEEQLIPILDAPAS